MSARNVSCLLVCCALLVGCKDTSVDDADATPQAATNAPAETSAAASASASAEAGDAEARCRTSMQCATSGRCTPDEDGNCIATSDEDCRSSKSCRREARCTVRDGQCVIGSSEDCQRGSLCEDYGACELDERLATCLAGAPEHCQNAKFICGYMGQCHFDGGCVAKSDADCKKAKVCAELGQCKMVDGTCDK